MGFRRVKRSLGEKGNTTMGTLALTAAVVVAGAGSFQAVGGSLEQATADKVNGSAEATTGVGSSSQAGISIMTCTEDRRGACTGSNPKLKTVELCGKDFERCRSVRIGDTYIVEFRDGTDDPSTVETPPGSGPAWVFDDNNVIEHHANGEWIKGKPPAPLDTTAQAGGGDPSEAPLAEAPNGKPPELNEPTLSSTSEAGSKAFDPDQIDFMRSKLEPTMGQPSAGEPAGTPPRERAMAAIPAPSDLGLILAPDLDTLTSTEKSKFEGMMLGLAGSPEGVSLTEEQRKNPFIIKAFLECSESSLMVSHCANDAVHAWKEFAKAEFGAKLEQAGIHDDIDAVKFGSCMAAGGTTAACMYEAAPEYVQDKVGEEDFAICLGGAGVTCIENIFANSWQKVGFWEKAFSVSRFTLVGFIANKILDKRDGHDKPFALVESEEAKRLREAKAREAREAREARALEARMDDLSNHSESELSGRSLVRSLDMHAGTKIGSVILNESVPEDIGAVIADYDGPKDDAALRKAAKTWKAQLSDSQREQVLAHFEAIDDALKEAKRVAASQTDVGTLEGNVEKLEDDLKTLENSLKTPTVKRDIENKKDEIKDAKADLDAAKNNREFLDGLSAEEYAKNFEKSEPIREILREELEK